MVPGMAPVVGSSPGSQLDPAVEAAVAVSNLGTLPPDAFHALTAEASRLRVPQGSTLHREGDEAAHVELVVSGLLRAYITASDGRTMTVRYCRRGSLIGVASLFASPFSLPASVQAVTDSDILMLRPAVVRREAERDTRVARALLDELSERVLSFVAEIPGSAFATVRQRVARHLLDLASIGPTGPELTVRVSQQEVADAVGTVREVVVRALRELREEGLLTTGREGIRLLRPERLSAVAFPGTAGTDAPVR